MFSSGVDISFAPLIARLITRHFTSDISVNSTVGYKINATANTGDFGALNGTFDICDCLEKLHQPPGSNETERVCPPSKGAAFIDYAAWFADLIVAPVRTDRKPTLDPDPCFIPYHGDSGASSSTRRRRKETGYIDCKQSSTSSAFRGMIVPNVCATSVSRWESVGCCKG